MPDTFEISTVYDVDRFIAQINGQTDWVADFSATTFTRPVGMVGLLAVMDWICRERCDRKIALILPQSKAVRTYWHRAGIMDALGEFCDFGEVEAAASLLGYDLVEPIVPCLHFRSEADIERLSGEMYLKFDSTLSGYSSLSDGCYEIFIESTLNVLHHAESNGGFVLAQKYTYDSGPAIEIAVADSGIGIRNSLNKNSELAGIDSDGSAIRKAMEEGVTSAGHSHRGYGLAHLTHNVQLEQSRRMVIRSGNGIITFSGDGEIREEDTAVEYRGTVVNVTIPLELPR